MTTPAKQDTMLSRAWPFPLFLLRTAWADQPYDVLTEYLGSLADAQLVEIVGDPVAMLDTASPTAGMLSVLPGLVAAVRRAGRGYAAPEILALLTVTPGDYSGVPSVPLVRNDVAESGWGMLVRDPRSGQGVCLTVVQVHHDVLRWRVRGIAMCPPAPQPAPPAQALAALSLAITNAAELIERSGSLRPATAIELEASVTPLPAGLPPRVVEILDRVDAIDSITGLALTRPELGADPALREPVLRGLVSAQGAARRAAVAAAGEAALRTCQPWSGYRPQQPTAQ